MRWILSMSLLIGTDPLFIIYKGHHFHLLQTLCSHCTHATHTTLQKDAEIITTTDIQQGQILYRNALGPNP